MGEVTAVTERGASELVGQLVRYGLTGGFVTALGAGVYWVTATFMGVAPLLANVFAYAIAVAVGYVLHSKWSFRGHGSRDNLDMSAFLSGDVGNQGVVRPGFVAPTKVERLISVVHQRGHLAVLATKQFLQGGAGIGICTQRSRQFDLQSIDAEKHDESSWIGTRPTCLHQLGSAPRLAAVRGVPLKVSDQIIPLPDFPPPAISP